MNENYLYSDITESIIKCFYKIYNKPGYGFLEKVYERAMLIELEKEGFKCLQQCPIDVYYESNITGHYLADIIVNGKIILEIKASENLSEAHETQLTNYLKGTEIEVGLLLNFGKNRHSKEEYFLPNLNHEIS